MRFISPPLLVQADRACGAPTCWREEKPRLCLTENRTNCRRIRQCRLQTPAVQIAGGDAAAAPGAVPIRWQGASALDPVFLQAVDERAAADPEPPRGLRLVAAGRRQRVLDLLA